MEHNLAMKALYKDIIETVLNIYVFTLLLHEYIY